MKYLVILFVVLGLGCATSTVQVMKYDGEKKMVVSAIKNSTFRKGPYYVTLTVPLESDQVAKITLAGNDEAMSGNLALAGTAIGMAAGGAPGAAAGGITGTFADWLRNKLGVDVEDAEEITNEVLETVPVVPNE